VEFVRGLQEYRLLLTLAPQTTSPIDLYDEKHFSVPKNPKSLTWHTVSSKEEPFNLPEDTSESRRLG